MASHLGAGFAVENRGAESAALDENGKHATASLTVDASSTSAAENDPSTTAFSCAGSSTSAEHAASACNSVNMPAAAAAAASAQPPRIVSDTAAFVGALGGGSMVEKFKRVQAELPLSTTVEVRFKNASFVVTRPIGAKPNPTTGDKCLMFWKALACVVPRVIRAAAGHKAPKVRKAVLDRVSGVFRPGEITVILGPPGSGKTTLLKLLGGRLRTDQNHIIEGDVLYNGLRADSGKFVLPRVAVLVEERDQHIPTLTVQETLQFAFDSMEGGKHASWITEAERTPEQKETLAWMDKNKVKVTLAMRALGLYNAKDIIVGSEGLRGVSGGERRRVTTAEMVVGSHDILLTDSISTGLDSSTTYDIISTARDAARVFKKTVVVALLQPPPEVFALFDNVCLLAGGHVIYLGPRDGAVPHFESLGYKCPPRKDAADFLVEVPTDQGAAFLTYENESDLEARGSSPGRKPSPRNALEFSEAWKSSEEFARLQAELAVPPAAAAAASYTWPPNQTRRHAGSFLTHFLLCLEKHGKVFRRDRAYLRQRVLTCLVMGLLLGSIFYNINPQRVNDIFGLLFFTLLFLAMASIGVIPQAIQYRAITYKQTDAAFYSAMADTLAQVCVIAALQLAEVFIFAPLVYFMVGLSTEGGGRRFISFMFMLMATNLCLAAQFRLLAAAFPDFARAQAAGGISIVFLTLFCGYLVPQSDIPPFWIWIFWLNPISWSFRAVVLNQFLSPMYAASGLGQAILDQYGFMKQSGYIWGGVAFVAAEFVAITLLTSLVLTYVRHEPADNARVTTSAATAGHEGANVTSRISEKGKKENEKERTEEFTRTGDLMLAHAGATDGEGAASIVPFTPVTLSFHDIWYSVPHPAGDGELDLLKGVSGYCEPGQMTALMGSSGAGKTTLLDVLAGRKASGTTKGSILVNGHPKHRDTFTRVAGYVEQNDVHSPAVTVREALEFSAELRLAHEQWDAASKKKFVESVLSTLELDNIADAVVGSEETGGLSIEQRKRVTIGVEMAANPSLLFFDEPTSGLDARAALVVMSAIRKVAATGRTVICTVHQPSTTLFEMFDSLLLLKKGGEVVYFGELGEHSRSMVDFLVQAPGTPSISVSKNPAVWMLEVIGAGTTGGTSAPIYADYYRNSGLRADTGKRLIQMEEAAATTQPLHFESKFAATLNMQRMTCLRRALTQNYRSATYNYVRMAVAVMAAIIYGSNFVGRSVSTEAQLVSRLGVLYIIAAFMGVVMLHQSIPFFAKERPVFYREQASNTYAFRAFVFGHTLAEIPYVAFTALLFAVVFYYMSEFAHDAAKFWYFYLYFCLHVTFKSFLGQFLTAALPSIKIAQSIGSLFTSLFSLFAGFLISPGQIPSFWEWAFWLDPTHYTVEGLVMSQYHDDETIVQTLSGPLPTNTYVEAFFGGRYSFDHRARDAIALVLFSAATRIGFYWAIKYVRHEKR